jgi:uncharacterized protein YybS (DUF2232 family)
MAWGPGCFRPPPNFTLQHPFNTRLKGPAGPALIALALTVAFIFVPLIGSLTVLLLPAPLAYAYYRNGQGAFTVTSLIVLGLASIWGFPVLTSMFLGLCLCGLALGKAAAKRMTDDKAVIWGTAAPLIILIPLAAAYFEAIGVNPIQLLAKIIDEGVKQSKDIYKQMGMSQTNIDLMMPSLNRMAQVIKDYFPALIVASAAATSFTAWVIFKKYALKSGAQFAEWDFAKWRLPDHLVWGIILPGFLMIPDVPVLRIISGNLLFVFAIPYVFMGIALLVHIFEKYRISPFLRILTFVVVILQPILAVLLWAVGFFDTWADFRKIRIKK